MNVWECCPSCAATPYPAAVCDTCHQCTHCCSCCHHYGYARGRVTGARDHGLMVWTYEVVDARGRVVLTDNGTGWERMLRKARRATAAADVVLSAGHDLPPFADLVGGGW